MTVNPNANVVDGADPSTEGTVEEVPVEFNIKILKVEGSEKLCVEFSRVGGDQLNFFDLYQQLRNELADVANA